jgi:hypothetical protein
MIGRMDKSSEDPQNAALEAAKTIPDATPEPVAQSTAEKTDPKSELATATNVGVIRDNDPDQPLCGSRDVAELKEAWRNATAAELPSKSAAPDI